MRKRILHLAFTFACDIPGMTRSAPVPMYRNQPMPVRVIDLARHRLRRAAEGALTAASVFNRINDAATEMGASDIDRKTALAYAVMAIRQERAAMGRPSWPANKHEARAALAVASTMAEMYDVGSIVNVSV